MGTFWKASDFGNFFEEYISLIKFEGVNSSRTFLQNGTGFKIR